MVTSRILDQSLPTALILPGKIRKVYRRKSQCSSPQWKTLSRLPKEEVRPPSSPSSTLFLSVNLIQSFKVPLILPKGPKPISIRPRQPEIRSQTKLFFNPLDLDFDYQKYHMYSFYVFKLKFTLIGIIDN